MKEKMTIILFSGDLDKAIAAFILATTAAASGMEEIEAESQHKH